MQFRIGHTYKDILSLSKSEDEFVSRFSFKGKGIGNSGGIRSANYIHLKQPLPAFLVLITRNISHRSSNPWEDVVDTNSATIFYWGDAKFDSKKKYDEFKGNKTLLEMWHHVLDGNLDIVPPILHFSKHQKGKVTFNGFWMKKRSIQIGYIIEWMLHL